MSDKDFAKVQAYFLRRIKNHSHVLSYRDLKEYVTRNKLSVRSKSLRTIRSTILDVAISRQAPVRPRHFMSIFPERLGSIYTDLGFYPKEKGYNNGFGGFICFVDASTSATHVTLIRNKNKETCDKAIHDILLDSPFPQVNAIFCDFEPSLSSPHFRERMYKLFGLKVHLLSKSTQSHIAENRIKVRTAGRRSIRHDCLLYLRV